MTGLSFERVPAPAATAAPVGAARAAATGRVTNAMSVDVEDYFQVSAFAGHIARESWTSLPLRVERNADRVLALFAAHGVRATFFTLGWVAERLPVLVRRIVAEGHELASHGFAHHRIDELDRAGFAADVARTKALLEDIGGVAVVGYRAPSFSIGERTLWAHQVLAEAGYRYSSSVYPIRHDHYGMPEAPRAPFAPVPGLLEIPLSTVRLGGRNLPCGGGGYFRLFPGWLTRRAIAQVNRREGRACVFYFHPWEIDPGQPRQKGVSLRTRVRHYSNLGRMEAKLECVLGAFAWDRIDRVFLAGEGG